MTTTEQIDARKTRMDGEQALDLLQGMSKMIVAKGKKVVEVNLKKDRPDDESIVKMMLGPTGNLRAPTMKVGKTLLIGFNAEMFESIFGS